MQASHAAIPLGIAFVYCITCNVYNVLKLYNTRARTLAQILCCSSLFSYACMHPYSIFLICSIGLCSFNPFERYTGRLHVIVINTFLLVFTTKVVRPKRKVDLS